MSRPRNDTFLRALLKEPTEYTPLWLMRQAGRYLPEYRETRARAGSFLDLCKSPSMACEVTLQPLARYDLDAAILFSDILTVPDAMGLGLYFAEGEGPKFERPLREEWEIRALQAPDPYDHLRYVMDGVSEIRRALDNSVPLIGFSGSPYTLACYMVEGGSSSDYRRIKTMLYSRPDLLHHILSVTADAVTAYRNAIRLDGATAARQVGLGEALTDAADGVVSAEAQAAFEAARKLEPANAKANFYLAIAMAQDGRKDEAKSAWQAMLASLPADSPWRVAVTEALAEIDKEKVAQAGQAAPTEQDVAAASSMSEEDRTAMIETMVAGLDEKLRENPKDAEGWMRLVRSYVVLGKAGQAKDALQRGVAAFGSDSEEAKKLVAFAASLGVPATE